MNVSPVGSLHFGMWGELRTKPVRGLGRREGRVMEEERLLETSSSLNHS